MLDKIYVYVSHIILNDLQLEPEVFFQRPRSHHLYFFNSQKIFQILSITKQCTFVPCSVFAVSCVYAVLLTVFYIGIYSNANCPLETSTAYVQKWHFQFKCLTLL